MDQNETAAKAIEKLVQEIFKTLFPDKGPLKVNAERVLFPHGVELIDLGAKVGPPNAPLVDFHLKIAGAAGAHGSSQPSADEAKGTKSPSQ
jgi:hypothetical protein